MHLPPTRRATAVVVAAACCAGLIGACGGGSSSDDSAEQAALVRDQIDDARTQAAREARNEERIKQLERDLRRRDREDRTGRQGTVTVIAPAPQPAPASSSSSSSRAGASGYMAQLGSFTSLSGAQSRQASLNSSGLSTSILRSDDYVELRPGYWVVYSGVFSSRASADDAVAAAKRAGVADAFARYITPRS